jgi:peptidoglycan/LPS O-acetylase OafA/YrhL
MSAFYWIAHLRRKTTSGDWVPEIDGLRFIAISSVLLFHMHNQLTHHYALTIPRSVAWLARGFGFGNRGVPLFFVISGFILARPFAQHHLFAKPAPSLSKYFLRRVTRLEPPYLLNLAAVAVGIAVADHQPWRIILPHLAASAVYMHYLIFHAPSAINSVAWSLEIEVQFYLLAPLLAMAFAVRTTNLRRILIVVAMVTSALIQVEAGISTFTLAGRLQYFLAGLLFADLFLVSMPLWRHHWAWDLVSLLGWPAFFLLGERMEAVWLPFLALLLCVAALRGVAMYKIVRNPWIAVMGGMCYTIYLWHAPVLTLVGRVLGRFSFFVPPNYVLMFALQGVVKIVALVLVCLPLFVLVERPCMDPRWPQKMAVRLRWAFRGPTHHRVEPEKLSS